MWDIVLSRTCDTLEVAVFSTCAGPEHISFPPMTPSVGLVPQTQQVVEGDDIRLSVSATCADTYQWRKDGADLIDDGRITGSQQNALTISRATANDTGAYAVAIANSYGTNVTHDVFVTVVPALRMTAQKLNGETLRLEVRRAGQIPFSEADLSNVKIYGGASLDQPFSAWPELSTSGTLTNGALLFDLPLSGAPSAQFFRAVEISR